MVKKNNALIFILVLASLAFFQQEVESSKHSQNDRVILDIPGLEWHPTTNNLFVVDSHSFYEVSVPSMVEERNQSIWYGYNTYFNLEENYLVEFGPSKNCSLWNMDPFRKQEEVNMTPYLERDIFTPYSEEAEDFYSYILTVAADRGLKKVIIGLDAGFDPVGSTEFEFISSGIYVFDLVDHSGIMVEINQSIGTIRPNPDNSDEFLLIGSDSVFLYNIKSHQLEMIDTIEDDIITAGWLNETTLLYVSRTGETTIYNLAERRVSNNFDLGEIRAATIDSNEKLILFSNTESTNISTYSLVNNSQVTLIMIDEKDKAVARISSISPRGHVAVVFDDHVVWVYTNQGKMIGTFGAPHSARILEQTRTTGETSDLEWWVVFATIPVLGMLRRRDREVE